MNISKELRQAAITISVEASKCINYLNREKMYGDMRQTLIIEHNQIIDCLERNSLPLLFESMGLVCRQIELFNEETANIKPLDNELLGDDVICCACGKKIKQFAEETIRTMHGYECQEGCYMSHVKAGEICAYCKGTKTMATELGDKPCAACDPHNVN